MLIIGINHIEKDLFLVETIMWFSKWGVHIDTQLVTADIKKYKLSCETFEVC